MSYGTPYMNPVQYKPANLLHRLESFTEAESRSSSQEIARFL